MSIPVAPSKEQESVRGRLNDIPHVSLDPVQWEWMLRQHLILLDLEGFINGKEVEPEENDPGWAYWKQRQKMAYYVIRTNLETDEWEEIVNTKEYSHWAPKDGVDTDDNAEEGGEEEKRDVDMGLLDDDENREGNTVDENEEEEETEEWHMDPQALYDAVLYVHFHQEWETRREDASKELLGGRPWGLAEPLYEYLDELMRHWRRLEQLGFPLDERLMQAVFAHALKLRNDPFLRSLVEETEPLYERFDSIENLLAEWEERKRGR